jgi:hypothetical protein
MAGQLREQELSLNEFAHRRQKRFRSTQYNRMLQNSITVNEVFRVLSQSGYDYFLLDPFQLTTVRLGSVIYISIDISNS